MKGHSIHPSALGAKIVAPGDIAPTSPSTARQQTSLWPRRSNLSLTATFNSTPTSYMEGDSDRGAGHSQTPLHYQPPSLSMDIGHKEFLQSQLAHITNQADICLTTIGSRNGRTVPPHILQGARMGTNPISPSLHHVHDSVSQPH